MNRYRFFCAAVAALTLRMLNPYGHGKLVLLEVNYTKDHHSNFIYLIAIILGIVGVRTSGTSSKFPLSFDRFIGCLRCYLGQTEY